MIFTRIKHLLTADVNGILDGIEDVVLSMKQDLRDMERALEQKRARHTELARTAERLARAQTRLGTEIDRLEADLALALDCEKDELARFCIRRLGPLEHEAELVAREREDVEREQSALSTSLAEQTVELQAMTARVEAAAAREGAQPGGRTSSGRVVTPSSLTDEEVDLELMRRKRAHAAR